MTEREWLTGTDATSMLGHVYRTAGDRKLRLLSVACWRLLKSDEGRETIGISERFADGQETKAALKRARQSVRAIRYDLEAKPRASRNAWAALWLAEVAASENAFVSLSEEFQRLAGLRLISGDVAKPEVLCGVIREVLGNPFRPIPFNGSKLTPATVALAETIYAEGAFQRLPDLVKRLRTERSPAPLLKHLAERVPHVRGCWALDLVLGRD